jgi:hypothetical protein
LGWSAGKMLAARWTRNWAKLTIGFSRRGMVYAPSAFFGSGFDRVNGSTILTILDIYVTAS